MIRPSFLAIVAVGTVLVITGAGREPRITGSQSPANSITTAGLNEGLQTVTVPHAQVGLDEQANQSSAAPLYHLNWYSVNGGGATHATGTNFDLGLSVGQSAAGFVSGTNYKLGVGFWYGAASAACPITLSGDVNLSTTITSSDIIVLVNYVFKGGAAPQPCAANGDVNCSGTVTSSDIIVLVNYVFKGGAAPCNICTIIPSMWSCP